ncbi:interferon-inducible GTPase 5-like [Pygocentrus nattereri]|uniref:IRG-type G domain-containing protein n=1 Tax=Pygocentrus nattereri TaxID=42514 RepID=A0A3B4C8X7_PYGNA|nr:interferon-inducible GTPase 5-like [Pygocentrus nattereri]
MASQNPEINEVIQASGESTLEGATRRAEKQVDELVHVSLSVAVTGETGAGKSTFINVIRGLDDGDNDAAETGVTETTTEPTSYKHPSMENVEFWDLPGIGSPNFKAKNYLKQVQFDRYDFFIIISSERFRENDIKLAKKIQKRKKLFYFVRSKIDNDIRDEAQREQFNEEETLSKIRRNCEENLKGIENPKVFLISSMNLSKFDFGKLVATLMTELPELKRQALLQSVPVSSLALLEEKVRMFKKAVWAVALLSGGVAAAPVPGLSFACDTSILLSFFTRCYYSFGLDDKSLDKLSKRVNKPHLKSLITSPLVLGLASKSAVRLQLSALAGSALVKNLCKLVPGVGNAAAGVISFTLTFTLLKRGLKDLADSARTMLREAGLE